MRFSSDVHRRRSIRMAGYDYSRQGAYFVTVCTREREHWFGEVIEHEVKLSAAGETVATTWNSLPGRFVGIALDAFVVMPNHVHGILVMTGPQIPASASTDSDVRRTPNLGEVVRTFKAALTSLIRGAGETGFAWQRNYHEHIIRSEGELNRVRAYIEANPLNWRDDPENPAGGSIAQASPLTDPPWAR